MLIKELEQEKIILKEINEFLEKEQSSNQEILDSMSHEFRTPLVTIKAYVDMTLNDKFGELNQKQRMKLEKVQESVEILIDVIYRTLKITGESNND